MKVSLIIVNYKAIDLTEALVDMVAGEVSETIVVDNASGDSMDGLRRRHPEVQVIELADNVGYGGGLNAGAAVASGDVLVFSNPDIEIAPSDLLKLAAAATAPEVGLVAPMFVETDGELQRSAHRREPRFLLTAYDVGVPFAVRLARRYPDWHPTLLSSEEHHREQDVLHVLGALNAVKAEAFAALGGFDESFFMYREETDLCRRLRRAGWRVRHFPTSVAVHHRARSTPTGWFEPGHPQAIKSHYRYIAKHWGAVAAVAARGVAVATLVAWLVGASHRRLALTFLRGHLGLT